MTKNAISASPVATGYVGRPSARRARNRFGEGGQRRQREREASLDAFKRNFQNPWAQTAGGSGNALVTSGGAVAGPLGMPGSDLRRGPSVGGLDSGVRNPVNLGPRGGGLDNFDPKNPLNYGAPETVLKQTEAPRVAPKPVVLEIPKRKF